MNKKGSAALETAIAFSVCLILLFSMLSIMNVYNADMIMHAAIEQSSENMAIYMPYTIVGSDLVSNVVNALPDSSIDSNTIEDLSRVGSGIYSVIHFFGYTPQDLLINGVFAGIYKTDVINYYYEHAKSIKVLEPEIKDIRLTYEPDRRIISVNISYTFNTIFGEIEKNAYSIVPFYGKSNLNFRWDDNTDVDYSETPESIWNEGNFERGTYFEEQYGGNLPHTYPVISNFENGIASSVVSIDTTSPYYSDENNLSHKIMSEIDELASFNGADVNISGNNYCITSSDINGRELIIVIPENTPSSSLDNIQNIENYAIANNIDMRIVQDGVSTEYI